MTNFSSLYGPKLYIGPTGGTGGTGLPGVNGMPWNLISTNTNATAGSGYLINATNGDITLTLPGAPVAGQTVGLCDAYNKATTSVITIARNGNNIESTAQDMIFDVNGVSFILSYVDTTIGWKIVSEADNVANALPVPLNFRNRIINGDMAIDQRNSGAEVTPVNTNYTVDRFICSLSQTGKLKFQQIADAPLGFTYSLRVTVLSQFSPGTGDYFAVLQPIEGLNIVDLNWGTVNASPITLSFWIKSSVAGTYSGHIRNGTGTISYIFTFTVSTSWTYKTIVIPGATASIWTTNNTTGLYMGICFSSGATYSTSTPGSWVAGNLLGLNTATQFVNQVNGSTINITGVQLEKGSVATPFEFRPYSVELELCQRYYQRIYLTAYGYSATPASYEGHTITWVPKRVVPSWVYVAGPASSDNLYPTQPYTLTINSNSSGCFIIRNNAAAFFYANYYTLESSGAEL